MKTRLAASVLTAFIGTGCMTVGPHALKVSRARYNEAVKATAEEEMLLNIVRLRYGDTPSSLAISNIAAQFELSAGAQATPFFSPSADVTARTPFPIVLPQAGVNAADRPTFSLTPLDDSDFVRRLFTPLSLDGATYLARTTWPISTVFRLYLENLNWVPNAETASGPTPAKAPQPSNFLEGLSALQRLQERGDAVFTHEERVEYVGGPIPLASITAQSAVEASAQGLALSVDANNVWHLERRSRVPVLHLNPQSASGDDAKTFRRVFHLEPGRHTYDVTVEGIAPFADDAKGFSVVDLETRSLLQALYFVAHGVEVPATHFDEGLARKTVTGSGESFDWSTHLRGLFAVRSQRGGCGGTRASTSVEYLGACFFIDATDHDSRTTFGLLMELARLELPSGKANAPLLTIPLR